MAVRSAGARRAWCVTSFVEENTAGWLALEDDLLRYLVWQKELSPGTGRVHLQAYAEFARPVRLRQVKRILGDETCHCEAREGSRDQARDYCRDADKRAPGAESGPWEHGEWRAAGQGRRSDLDAVHQLLRDGCSEVEISDAHFATWARYWRAFERFRLIHIEPRSWKPQVSLYWGPTGTGKSSLALAEAADPYWVPPPRCSGSAPWFEGYQGQSDVIFDDFRGSIPYQTFLRLLDRYPMRCENKHGSFEFVPRRIWVTSNEHPFLWYQGVEHDPMMRRVDVCLEFTAFHVCHPNPVCL